MNEISNAEAELIAETQPLLESNPPSSSASASASVSTAEMNRVLLTTPPSPWKRRIAATTILLTLTLERLAFYSLTANLYLYLNRNPLNWMSYNAMTASYVFTGVAYLTAIVGGWIADGILGKFWTVVSGLLLYTVTYSGLAYVASYGQELPKMCLLKPKDDLTTTNYTYYDMYRRRQMDLRFLIDNHIYYDPSAGSDSDIDYGNDDNDFFSGHEICSWQLYLILVGVGVSVGVVRANIAPFGADQVRNAGPDAMRHFFNWFYWCINIGGFVALGAVAYVEQVYGNGFFIGYMTAVVALSLAVLLFAAGRPFYEVQKPTGSIFINVLRIVREAYRSQIRRYIQQDFRRSYSEEFPSPSSVDSTSPSWLDMAKVRFGGSFQESAVDDVKALGKILIVFISLIPFWIVYFQMQTSFLAQGLHMKLNPFATHLKNTTDNITIDTTFTVPAAWLTLFDVTFLLILIPVMDRAVYPFLDKHHMHMGLLAKISCGMMFALASVVVAGCLEFYRLRLIHNNNSTLIIQVVGNTTYLAADLWIFWQVPQYALIGISEVFASVASLEFAYSKSPKSMQGIIMGLHCFCTGIGSFTGTGLLEVVRSSWFSTRDYGSLNQSHLDYYFFLLGAIQLVGVIVFNVVAKRFNVDGGDSRLSLSEEEPSTQVPIDDVEPIFKQSGSRMTRGRQIR